MAEPAHVVLFPWNEQSHVTPIFSLGRALANRGLHVTCGLPATLYSSYRVIHKNTADALFHVECIEDADSADLKDLVVHVVRRGTEQGLLKLLVRLQPPPTCLISDMLYTWVQDVADRFSIPCFKFSVFPAITNLICCHIPDLLGRGLLPFQPGTEETMIDFIPGVPKGFRLKDIPIDFLGRSTSELKIIASMLDSRKEAGLVINTTYRLEAESLDALSAEGLQVYPVGPMFTMDWKTNEVHNDSSLHLEDEDCLRWLDGQPEGSVVYVAFGSIISLTKCEMQEVAMGLEASGQPFLWVVRSVEGSVDAITALPSGFRERNQGRGRVVSWAPQAAVLSHPSVGCFISHCGYSSVLEALWTGVPILACFYKISDQNTVFKVATDEWGVALPLVQKASAMEEAENAACGDYEGKPLRLSIEAGIKELMHTEKGNAVKRRCMQMKADMREVAKYGGSSEQSLDKLFVVLREKGV
ncbi:hypothetical protein KP509_18G035100 [Ceratopteris richardii]|uniref:Glycosyltransferase n=1 Tax=Ceratopteris richardii TaxID=49495 RepID=A0A8T2SNL7_CERRI|nr:hypothetical protein KP509_18G035100 [Ceratopteris richardii]